MLYDKNADRGDPPKSDERDYYSQYETGLLWKVRSLAPLSRRTAGQACPNGYFT